MPLCFSYKCLSIKIPATKKGNSGSLNLTKEPKLATVNPTEKAKNKENNILNNNNGFFHIKMKKPLTFSLINKNIVSINK